MRLGLSYFDGNLSLDAVQHLRSTVQTTAQEWVKSQFPSFSTLGLGRSNVEANVIKVVDENLLVKQ